MAQRVDEDGMQPAGTVWAEREGGSYRYPEPWHRDPQSGSFVTFLVPSVGFATFAWLIIPGRVA